MRKPPANRPLPIENEIAKRDTAFEHALEELIGFRGLSPEVRDTLALELRKRPAWVKTRELELHLQSSIYSRPLPPPKLGGLPTEDAVMLATVRATRSQSADHASTKRSARGIAKKLKEGFFDSRVMFRDGAPTHPYKDLIIQYIDAIERATGKRFTFSAKLDGQIYGYELKLLHAALDRALFASDSPTPAALARIVRSRRAKKGNI